MIIDRFQLAEITGPIRMARTLHQQISLDRGPVPVEQIAFALGIADICVQSFDGFEGMLLTDNRRSIGAILANNTSGEQRTRFTIAHELGHFLLERHQLSSDRGFQCRPLDMLTGDPVAEDQHKRQEAEANQFAAELIAPKHLVQKSFQGPPEFEQAQKVAGDLNISLEVSIRRMVELSAQSIAAVWSQSGVVRYHVRSKGFPFIICRAGQSLPTSCKATEFVASGDTGISAFEQAPAGVWVSNRSQNIMEQTRLGNSGYAVTLLLLDEAEEDDDDGSVDELSMPSFR